jgi:hypothetical protein
MLFFIPLTIIPLTIFVEMRDFDRLRHRDNGLRCFFFAISAFSCGQFVPFGCGFAAREGVELKF